MSNRKDGSFMAKVKCADGTFNEYTIKPLSQQEIEQGWQLVRPRRNKYLVKYTNEEDVEKEPNTTNN
jgi:hypothetical protein